MLRGEDDYENYFEDTMRAGHYENNKRAVDLMIRSSNDIIRDLLRYHVDFARDGLGNLAFTREGAHSQPRILFHEDITGKEITQTLLTAAKIKENIEICEYMTMVDLISKDNTVCGSLQWTGMTRHFLFILSMWFLPAAESAGFLKTLPTFRILREMVWELQ